MSVLNCPVSGIDMLLHIQIEAGHHGHCSTPPGHVLHYIYDGHYELSINHHRLQAGSGDMILYHGIESVEWIHNPVPVSFYSIVFQARQLPPKPYTRRVIRGKKRFQQLMADSYGVFHSAEPDALRLHTALLEILSNAYRDYQQEGPLTADNPWPLLEQRLHEQQCFRPSLHQCCMLSGYSSASLSRYCHELHQQSPMQRLRFIRLQHAQSLLRLSSMSISQIARHLGYPRVHELSREFKQHCNSTPSAWRADT